MHEKAERFEPPCLASLVCQSSAGSAAAPGSGPEFLCWGRDRQAFRTGLTLAKGPVPPSFGERRFAYIADDNSIVVAEPHVDERVVDLLR